MKIAKVDNDSLLGGTWEKRLRLLEVFQGPSIGFTMFRIAVLLGFAATLSLSQIGFAQTPHRLLQGDKPQNGQQALELMKQDPTWVSRTDAERRTPLHLAARYEHTEVVKWLLANGADVNAQAYNNFTPLHLTKNPEIVKLILAKKPNLKLKSVSGTVLQKAIEDLRHYRSISDRTPDLKREADALKQIVNLYAEYLGDDIDLVSAIRLGRLETVQKIIADDPTTAHRKGNGKNPLREAAGWGRLEICKFLIEKHNVDVDDFKGGVGYPIIKAALKHPEIVKYLIEQGADLKTRITWTGGRTGIWIVGDDATALHFAASDGALETVKVLLDAGVDPFANAISDRGIEKDKQTALEVAAFFGKTDNAIAILQHPSFKSADIKIRQPALDRSLLIGSSGRWLALEAQDGAELVEALIAHGANVDSHGEKTSSIQIAVQGMHPNDDQENESIKRIVAVLRKHGAKMDVFAAVAIGDLKSLATLLDENPKSSNSYSIGGYPALHMAIKMNRPKAVKLLLDAGCDVQIPNKSESTGTKGDTALMAAEWWGRKKIAAMLIDAGATVNAKNKR